MQYKDMLNQNLKEKDQVLFSLGLGQSSIATVVCTESGLDPKNPQPLVRIAVEFTLPVAPNGLVPGIIKVAEAAPAISQ